MCGIVGAINGNGLVLGAADIQRMADCVEYRGPDSSGVWEKDGAILGHRRLAIVDLSAAGHQPMLSRSGRYALTFNGEIYNHLDLRAALERDEPITWRGHSDTETLVEALARWGTAKTLSIANGMFAFALWDMESRTLTLARDRFGEKPLLYSCLGGGIVFASELKSFRYVPHISRTPDPAVVARYLQGGTVPAPHSILPGVRKLMPGSLLVWSAAEGPREQSYWSPRTAYEAGRSAPLRDRRQAVDELEPLLTDAVKIRMMSDVPLGSLLSGGIDSSLITAIMQRASSRPVRTFSVAFEDAEINEAAEAQAVARHLGTQHEMLPLHDEDAIAAVPRMGAIYDEPFADASQVPTYLVSALTRRHVTVALTGDGFDELFSGYARYVLTDRAWSMIRRIPQRRWLGTRVQDMPPWVLNAVASGLGLMVPRGVNPASMARKLRHSGSLLSVDHAASLYSLYLTAWPEPEQLMLAAKSAAPNLHAADVTAACTHDQWMLCDQLDYLPNDILTKVDRASMAVSLETRIPALDPRIAEFAWRIAPENRWHAGRGKSVLRELLYRYVPQELVDRPKKGFAVPLERWLRGPLKGWAEDMISLPLLRRHGLLDPEAVRAKWQAFLSGGEVTATQMWTVLMLQSWMENWLG